MKTHLHNKAGWQLTIARGQNATDLVSGIESQPPRGPALGVGRDGCGGRRSGRRQRQRHGDVAAGTRTRLYNHYTTCHLPLEPSEDISIAQIKLAARDFCWLLYDSEKCSILFVCLSEIKLSILPTAKIVNFVAWEICGSFEKFLVLIYCTGGLSTARWTERNLAMFVLYETLYCQYCTIIGNVF